MNKEVIRLDRRKRPPRSICASDERPEPACVYKLAASERPLETRRWNLHKYLTGRGGHLAAVFAADSEPIDARVIDAIMKELPLLE
jgi:glutathione peroxidase-family protein